MTNESPYLLCIDGMWNLFGVPTLARVLAGAIIDLAP